MKLRKVEKEERRERVKKNLEAFGLSGFEDSYPKGIIRRDATEGSAFTDGADGRTRSLPRRTIWLTRRPDPGQDQHWLLDLLEDIDRTILFITHDIEEGLFLSEKIIVLSDRPAVKKGEFDVDLTEEERDKTGRKFFEYKRKLMNTIEEVDENAKDETVRQLL